MAGDGAEDWDEAFAHHPRIGERPGRSTVSATAGAWSAGSRPPPSVVGRQSEPRWRRPTRHMSGGSAGSTWCVPPAGALRSCWPMSQQNEERSRAGARGRRGRTAEDHPASAQYLDRRAGVMTRITSHVLDTSTGQPASGLTVRLERSLRQFGTARLGHDGCRRPGPRLASGGRRPGRYRLVFETGAWFRAAGRDALYPEVIIDFEVQDGVRTIICRCSSPRSGIQPTGGAEPCHNDWPGTLRQGSGAPGEGGSG